MNEDEVRNYVEHAQSIIDSSPQMDEANTKAAVLRNFLDLIGWEIPENTQLEYSVNAFGRTYKVDYALILEGAPVAFLEAKGVDTSLTNDHREKVRNYLKNEDVNLGILTNGEDYEFFRRQVIDSTVEVNTLARTRLQNLPNQITILRAFTKDAIENDEWETILNRIRELQDAQEALEQNKDDLAANIATLLTDNISETISTHAESQGKEMIDRLITDIEQEINQPPEVGDAIAGTKKRRDIPGLDDSQVAVFPTKKSGVDFLRENNAWGFVRIGQKPDFVAMYVSEDVQQVKYIAAVKEIVQATEADLARSREAYYEAGSSDAQAGFDPDKKVILFEKGSLYELEDPISFEGEWPQSLRYTSLGALQEAETTDDLF